MRRIPVILDVDTGVDDAIAIACACYIKELDVKLIATGSGNATVENITRNTLNILQFIQCGNINVAKGRGKKFKDNSFVLQVHGESGMGDYNFEPLKIKPQDVSAVEAMHSAIAQSSEPITIITMGPMSNLAELLTKYPQDAKGIGEIVISGGFLETLKHGEKPYTSFNVAYDDAGAKVVLNSGIKLIVVPSNMGHIAYLDYQDIFKIKNTNDTGVMFEKLFRDYHDRHIKNGVATHDLCAVLSVSNPEIFEYKTALCTVKRVDSVNAGIMQFNFETAEPNAMVATNVNVKKFKKIYFKTLKQMP